MSIEFVQSFNQYTALATIFLLIAGLYLLYDYKTRKTLESYVETFGIKIAFVLTLFGSAMTLFYSEVIGYLPCGLCWLERMMLYPQVIILAIAWKYNDFLAVRHTIGLSVIGFIISLYHHYIQMGGSEFVACPTTGVSCSKRLVFEYGFVTFPLMATILFGSLIVLYLYIHNLKDKSFVITS